ncbi:MAG: tryptophan-rich sensory protein [Clostridia bacterium]|nr:tryptophan-rich sensory protein [Clostridia bacterium]
MPNNRKSMPIDWKTLLISVLFSLGVGLVSGFLSMNDPAEYANLSKPSFAPPSTLFGPVWIVLYILMGYAAYRVYKAGFCREEAKDALFYYGSQLIFNFMWSFLFFRFHLRGVALLDLVVLLIFVIITTIKFFKIDHKAGLLMLPYIVWLIFAAILNFSIWRLNG